MILTKEQILSAKDFKVEEIEVPEWGGSVCIRTLTGAERNELEIKSSKKQLDNFIVLLCQLCICDEEGKQLFSRQEGIEKLNKKTASSLDKVFQAASKLNVLSKEAVEELEKKSEAESGSDSSSAYAIL